MEKKTPGVRQTLHGWQVFAKVRGEFVSRHFPPGTTLATLIEARKNLVAAAQLGLDQQAADDGATFAADVKAYLKAKAGMPTLYDRTHRIEWWRDVLGRQRTRDSVTSLEVRHHLEEKRKAGAKPGTLNVYRTALLDFYTVLNGKSGANPVRDIPPYREEELPLVLPSQEDVQAALDCLRVFTTRDHFTRLRLTVLWRTGWPSGILKRLRPQDLHPQTRTVTVHGRKKGGGTKPRTLPVSAEAWEALQAFAAAKAFGSFSGSALYKALHTAQATAGVAPFSVYALRHLFVTTIVTHSADERGAAELALHTSPKQTWRYSRQAASTRAKAALDAAFPSPATPSPAPPPANVGRPKLVRLA
jgi:integrase